MAAQTKTGGGTIVLILAIVVAGGFFAFNRKDYDQKRGEERGVKLSVLFEPTRRVTNVVITVTLDGAPVHNNDKTKVSPWETVIMMRKGQRVILTATQEVPASLSCAVYDVVQETRAFPGSVVCVHTHW